MQGEVVGSGPGTSDPHRCVGELPGDMVCRKHNARGPVRGWTTIVEGERVSDHEPTGRLLKTNFFLDVGEGIHRSVEVIFDAHVNQVVVGSIKFVKIASVMRHRYPGT